MILPKPDYFTIKQQVMHTLHSWLSGWGYFGGLLLSDRFGNLVNFESVCMFVLLMYLRHFCTLIKCTLDLDIHVEKRVLFSCYSLIYLVSYKLRQRSFIVWNSRDLRQFEARTVCLRHAEICCQGWGHLAKNTYARKKLMVHDVLMWCD